MFKGRPKYATWYGAIATIAVYVIMLYWFVPKILQASGAHNPSTSMHKQSHFYDNDYIYDTLNNDFRFAFSIEATNEKVNKIDPAYTKLFARMSG